MVRFDPRDHPRDQRTGAFVAALESLRTGEWLNTPDGQMIKRKGDWSSTAIKRDGTKGQTHWGGQFFIHGELHGGGAERVAGIAMKRSAASTHPQSLGGGKRFNSLAHYEERERKMVRRGAVGWPRPR